MTITTKVYLVVFYLGAVYFGGYKQEYKEAFELLLIMLVVINVWYKERKADKK